MSQLHADYVITMVERAFLQAQLQELRGRCLGLDDIRALYEQHEVLRCSSPSGCLRLRELPSARRDNGAGALVLGASLTEQEWASVLESIACADEEQTVNADLFLRIYFEVQLLRARGVSGSGWDCPEPSVTRIKMTICEVAFYIRHINAYLSDDALLKDVLPIGMLPSDLINALKDGVLLCKLINLAVPQTIDERVINIDHVLSEQKKLENHTLCLQSAMAIGCATKNIKIGDLAEGRTDVVLDLVSQIIKMHLLKDINLKSWPELSELAENRKDSEDLMRMPPENLLIKWINHILEKGGFKRRISNLSSDIRDSMVYAYLLSILAPEFDVKAAMLRVGYSRAEKIMDAANAIGCNIFLTPQNIVDGLPNLNLAFVADIFQTRNGLSSQGIQKCLPDIHLSREERFFRLWINNVGISICIHNLFEDLRDGCVLLEIADKIAPGYVDWSIANPRPVKQQSKKLENCKQVLKIADKLRFPLPRISEKYITDGNKQLLSRILWEMERYNMLQKLKNLGFQSTEMDISANDILVWANKKVEESSKNSGILSFQDKSLSGGSFFLSLLSALDPDLVKWSHATQGRNEHEKKSNAQYIISIARKYNCSVFLLPEDILDVNEKMMLTFTASILSRHLEKSTSHSVNNENECSSSNGDSNIPCNEDTDFILEPVGQAVRKRFILPRAAYVPLLDYQKESLRWFWRLFCEGNGGILADDMGLGKTRQVVVFILGLFHSQLIQRALIITPPTLLKQWEKELFDQGLTANVKKYYGVPTERYDALHRITEDGGVLLTTYDLIRSDHKRIKGDSTSLWNYTVVDEGHLIKNSRTKVFKALLQIPCNHRIVVSGTPVQNCTQELWTLFSFCHPTLLPGWRSFKRDFSSPISKGNYKDSSNNEVLTSSKASRDLRNMIKPYILRREKEMLVRSGALGDRDLGNKTEIVVWLEMTPLQITLYEELIRLYKLFRKKKVSDKKKQAASFVTTTLLQKVSNHPLRICKEDIEEESETETSPTDDSSAVDDMTLMDEMVSQLRSRVAIDDVAPTISSCKLKFVIELLGKMLEPETGHRVLIFSQTRQMLDSVQDILSTAGYDFLRIDGTTKVKDRDLIVERFSDAHGPPVLLLSSRVGGLGLNLTAADRVIIVDPAWNPSVDAQSVDRVYRLGQKKQVYIYRLISTCTIEEKVYEEQVSKTSIFKATSEDADLKRYIFKKRKNDFFTLPKNGWAFSQVQKRFERESQNYELDPELSAHLKFLRKKNIIGVSIHSMLFKETIPLPTNIVESGDIKSFSTATSYRRQSSADIIKNAEHLARDPKELRGFQQPSRIVSVDELQAEIEHTEFKILHLQNELKLSSNIGLKDAEEKTRERISELEVVLQKLLSKKDAMTSRA